MGETVVAIKQGKLCGFIVQNVIGGSYLYFRGIPYAQPPVGDLRFMDPQPVKPWTGIRNALREGPKCPQPMLPSSKIEGDEDCLYLNVATTLLTGSRAVMVWIHGGGFEVGCGDGDTYSPDYLVKKDIVFVSINYRLNVFGFLNMDPEQAPGNVGLKDQTAALKWVKDNISAFGGDPNNVTIFGESAGGAAVHLHTLSPLSKGLFHKAIAQSGVSINPWVWSNKNAGYQLAAILGKDTTDSREAVEFLRTIPAHKLVEVLVRLVDPEENASFDVTFPFGPTLEEKGPKPFVPRNFDEAVQQGTDVPFIIGHNTSEGAIFVSEVYNTHRSIFDEVKAPLAWIRNASPKVSATVTKELKKIYFEETTTGSSEHVDNYIQCIGDIQFLAGIHEVADIQATNHTSTYLYEFSHRGNLNVARTMFNVEEKGTMHFEDIGYIFYASLFPDHLPKEGTLDRMVLDRFVQMWTDFAKSGNPTPQIDDLITEKWKPLALEAKNYLEIGTELKSGIGLHSDKQQAWKRIHAMIKDSC